MILVHDDLDLPVGVVRARMGGSAGGHHVRSVIEAFQTGAIRRVKIGVGRPAQKSRVRQHVLTPFSPVELPVIETACGVAADHVLALLIDRSPPGRTAGDLRAASTRPGGRQNGLAVHRESQHAPPRSIGVDGGLPASAAGEPA